MAKILARRTGLADFLKTRRARLHPEQFGLPTFSRRRTAGLRREELAQLIGVGISWYTWLEQGRDIQVSDEVLERLADILRLNEEERSHLFVLARASGEPLDEADLTLLPPDSAYQAALDAFIYPARLLDQRLNVVAWNACASRIFGDFASRSDRERNTAWSVFIYPATRELLVDWEKTARRSVAFLRAKCDRYPTDTWLMDLVADLQQASPEFRNWWPLHDVLLDCQCRDEINHPLLGRLLFQPTIFSIPERPDWQMIVYTPLVEDTVVKIKGLMKT
jgi:transcriptional regulator with XRE-family HTH domain